MPIQKRVLCPARLRKVPPQFNWIDQRLVRDKHIGRVSHAALALYLFLLTVADAQGLICSPVQCLRLSDISAPPVLSYLNRSVSNLR